MISQLLKAAKIPAKEGRFVDPPAGTYGIYFDEVNTDGPDGFNWILTHDGTVELYEPRKDDEAEKALESQLDAQGIRYHKQSRYWLDDVQRYQVVYEFTFIERRRT